MSVSEDRTSEAAVQPAVPAPGISDPAPIGLAAFAATTFLLSAVNAGWSNASTGSDWLGYALGLGGLVQLLAGMWEVKNRNVFGSTAFSTYGGFWIGLAIWAIRVAPTAKTPAAADHDLGWILLAFAIFNAYMLLLSTQVNLAIFLVFAALQLALIFLFIGNFAISSGVIKLGGYLGVLTALLAWYTSAAVVSNGMGAKIKLPVGKPLIV